VSDASAAAPVGVPTTVVVAVDRSAPAAVALRWAACAAGAFAAELVVVHARGMLEGASGPAEAPEWLLQEIAELVDEGVAVRLAIDDGAAADVVLRVAEREGAGLVVVGRRGSGSPYELILGSTSREVASRSPVAVVIVPH
jgi:nucleotide-binding universal stress UspA family protein